MTTSTPLYTSESGKAGTFVEFDSTLAEKLGFGASPTVPTEADYGMDDYCFVCSRPTDHRGEHDDLVEQGLAAYDAEQPIVLNLAPRGQE